MQRGGCVYIVSNKNRTVLYTGVTANLYIRASQHKQGRGSAFTQKYNCTDLLYFEMFGSIEEAIKREKQLKKWNRAWKEKLIKEHNPEMRDLYGELEKGWE